MTRRPIRLGRASAAARAKAAKVDKLERQMTRDAKDGVRRGMTPRSAWTRSSHGVIGVEAMESSIDRDEARQRELRAHSSGPSTSEPLVRCGVCGQWPRWRRVGGGASLCVGDGGPGHPYVEAGHRRS